MILILIFSIFLAGCQGGQLKPDPVTPAIDANYPTAEFSACGKLWHGLGHCHVKAGVSLSSISLKIQGYYKGTIKSVSSCGLDQNKRYENSENVLISTDQKAEKPCVVTFVVSPEYPKEKDSPIVVNSFQGTLAISVGEEGETSLSYVSKIKESLSDSITINTGDESPKRVVVIGCGFTFDKSITPSGKKINLKSSDVFSLTGKQKCILSGAVSTNPTTYFTWMAWVYTKEFQPLSIPVVEVRDGSVYIEADPTVSIISAGDKYKLTNSGTIYLDTSKSFIVRAITVSGRSAIGVYSPESKVITWKQ